MKNIIREELLSKLLIEGRLQDIIKKYGKEDQEDIDDIMFFSEKDPSGNNKYLEWLVKNWLTPLGGGDIRSVAPNREVLVNTVELFHDNLQRINNKDINSYKTFGELRKVTNEAKKKKKEKELKRKAKSEKKVIYEDDKWLVISPKSWEASCYYGAGTKWCVSSKNHRVHWDQYSRRSNFFYVIDKEKTKKDPLYKVAYRILSSGKEEIWDAEDKEISKEENGVEWFESLPIELVEKSKKHAWSIFPERIYGNSWIDDDQYAQALVDVIGTDNIFHTEDMYYDCIIYRNEDNGKYYAVGDEDMVDTSLITYYESMSDSELVENLEEIDDFVEMHDVGDYAEDYAKSMVGDLTDEQVLDKTNKTLEYEEMLSDIQDLRDQSDDIDYQIADLNDEDEGVAEEEESLRDEQSDIEDQIQAKENTLDEYLDEIRDYLVSDITMNIESEIEIYGVVNFFVHEKGIFKNVKDLLTMSDDVYLDREGLIKRQTDYLEPVDATDLLFDGADSRGELGYSDDGEEFYIGQIQH